MEPEIISAAPSSHDWMTRFRLKFYRLKTLIRRRWWVLALTTSIGLAVEAWLLFSTPTTYRSTGLLSVSERLKIPEGTQVREEEEHFYGTQLQMLQNQDILARAQRRLALDSPQLSGTVEITPTLTPRTSIFTIEGIGSNPEYTRRFVDAVMEEFINFKREQLGQTTNTAMTQISAELARLSNERDSREKEMQQFIKTNNMAFWDEQGKTAAKYLSDLKTRQANLATELQSLENLTTEQLLSRPSQQNSTGQNDPSSGQSATASDLNRQFTLKSQELIQKQSEVAEKSRIWKADHPKLIALKNDVAALQRLLSTIKVQNRETSQVRVEAIKAELAGLDTSVKEWETKVMEASQKDAEYQRLEGALNRTNKLYEQLLLSIRQIGIGEKVDTGSLQIMQHATLSVEVPRGTVRRLLTGLALGMIVGGLLLMLLDRADDRFSSSTEIMEHFPESILGQIPNVELNRGEGGIPLLQTEDERYSFAEAFRSLRSSLIFMPNQSELKTLLVTSAIPGEGKSTIASDLAITMAVAGARVLLVDSDLRRGDLATLFETDGRLGLSSVLRGEVPWKSVAQATKYPKLLLLPRGPVTNQSGELLLRPLMDQLLAEWKSEFDLVIFNTSPILATDDTPTIAPNFDGTIMVMRAQFTSARLVRNSLNALYQRQVNVLGLVLNGVDTEMPDYYYYQYPKYYAA